MKAILLTLLLSGFSLSTAAETTIVVATDLWPPYFTRQSGDGLYQEILRKVYPGHQIRYIYTSYARSKHLVITGKADLWLASYADEEAQALYPRYPYDADILTLVRLSSTPWQHFQNLQNSNVGWIQAYELDKYLPDLSMNIYEVPSIEDGLRMLLAGRIHYYLDDRWNVEDYLQSNPQINQAVKHSNLALLPLYPGFANNARNQALIRQWDKALAELQQSGQLEAMYKSFDTDYVATACHRNRAPAVIAQWSALPCLTLPAVED